MDRAFVGTLEEGGLSVVCGGDSSDEEAPDLDLDLNPEKEPDEDDEVTEL